MQGEKLVQKVFFYIDVSLLARLDTLVTAQDRAAKIKAGLQHVRRPLVSRSAVIERVVQEYVEREEGKG